MSYERRPKEGFVTAVNRSAAARPGDLRARGIGIIDANITGSLGPIGFATERSVRDPWSAFGDMFFQRSLRWTHGVHNYMVYGMANAPMRRNENIGVAPFVRSQS